jgi:hypothetical protein
MKAGDRVGYRARCAWSRDGKAWAGLAEDRVLLVRGKETTPIRTKEAIGVAFTPDGATLVIAERSGPVRLIRTATGKETARLSGWPTAYSAMALSRDGKRLAIAGGGGKVTIRAVSGRDSSR